MPSGPPRRPGRSDRRPARPSRPDPRPPLPHHRPPDPLIGRTIAGCELLERITADPVCTTYKANQGVMARLVAFRVLNPQVAGDPAAVARFYETAKFAAQVHHPNLAGIYDVSSAEDLHFLTQEYVEGRPLGEILHARQKIASVDAIRVAIAVAEALRFGNAKGMPGFRLSADSVIITSRNEVKLLPPSLTPAGSPVLGDDYVLTALGILLYAMLTGGRVPNLEAALESGSSAAAALPPIRKVALGTRQDLAAVVERLLGRSAEGPYADLEAGLVDLRRALETHERLESRTRTATARATERHKRGLYGVAIAAGGGLVVLIGLIVFIVSQQAKERGIRAEFAEAQAVAKAALVKAQQYQTQFYRTPTQALAEAVVGEFDQAKAAYAPFQAKYPSRGETSVAANDVELIDKSVETFRAVAQEQIRLAEARARIDAVRKSFDNEVAQMLERGGRIQEGPWLARYSKLSEEYANSPRAQEYIAAAVRRLRRDVQTAEMKIDTNQLINDFNARLRPAHRYGESLAAWKAYREKYDKIDAVRKDALDNCDKQTEDIKREARLQYAQLTNRARFLAQQQKDVARAREIYKTIIDNFGIPEHVERAKEELAKLPKE